MFAQAFGPKEREVVASIQANEDNLEELNPWERYTHYRDNYVKEYAATGGVDLTKPQTDLRRFHPFNSLGLNIGIEYRLGK